MRIAAIVLFLLAILSVAASTAQMSAAFRTPAPNPALMATEISHALLFPMAGALCFVASIALFIIDFILRRRRPTQSAGTAE